METRDRPVEVEVAVPILAKIWEEDGIWNISAFDIPVVAYGDDFDSARSNFKEALACHLDALGDLGKLEDAISHLTTLAAQRSFYEDRLQAQDLVQKFVVSRQSYLHNSQLSVAS